MEQTSKNKIESIVLFLFLALKGEKKFDSIGTEEKRKNLPIFLASPIFLTSENFKNLTHTLKHLFLLFFLSFLLPFDFNKISSFVYR